MCCETLLFSDDDLVGFVFSFASVAGGSREADDVLLGKLARGNRADHGLEDAQLVRDGLDDQAARRADEHHGPVSSRDEIRIVPRALFPLEYAKSCRDVSLDSLVLL